MEKEDALRDLVATCIQNALVGIREVHEAVFFSHDSPLISVVTTLARLKLLEITILQTASADLGIAMKDLPQVLDDVGRSVLLQMAAVGAISPADAAALYPTYQMESTLTKAADGPKAYESFSAAQKVFSEAMTKVAELRKE